MRERRLASRLGFHGAGSAKTSTRPSVLTLNRPKTQETAELLHACVVFTATPAFGGADRKPDLVACGRSIDGLKHKFEGEAPLHLADDDEFG